jgi:tetratricopeptide (TPR) repeat protein
LVDVAVALRRFPDARHHLDILLEMSPEDVDLLGLSSQCQYAMGEYSAASVSLRKAIEKGPARLEYYFRLATLLHDRLNDAAQAQSILDEMVHENVADHRAYLLRGSFRMAHPTDTPTNDVFDEQPGEAPITAQAPNSNSQLDESSLDAAIRDAREALKIAHDDEAAIVFAVRCFLAANNSADADTEARRGLKLHPKNASMFASLSNIALRAENREEAISWLQQGLLAVPSQPNLLWNLVNVLIDAGLVAEAEAPVLQLRELRQPQALLEYLASRILIAKGKWFEASQRLEGIRAALSKWPDVTKQADLKLGQCYEALGRPDLQLLAFRRAIGIDRRWLPPRL